MTFLRWEKEALLNAAESLSETADTDPRSRWIAGVGFALLPAILGTFLLGRMVWQYWQWENVNPSAMRVLQHYLAWGLGLLAIGALMHFHFFWTPHPKYHAVGWVGKNLAAGLIALIILTVFLREFANLF